MRLPRDWLGPREDLIPFGPRATELRHDESADSPGPFPRVQTPVPDAPSPSDFWGEHSADMHHVVQRPESAADAAEGPAADGAGEPAADAAGEPASVAARRESTARPVHPGAGRQDRPATRRRLPRGARWRRWAERPVAGGTRAVESVRRRMRGPLLAAGALIALLTVLVAAIVGTSTPSRSDGRLHLAVANPLRGDLATGRLRIPNRFAPVHRTRTRGGHRNAHRARSSHRRAARSAPTRVPVSTAASPTSSSSSSSGAASTSGSSAGSTASSSGSDASSGSGSGSGSGGSGGSSSTARGPVGPGAPFGPGHLG